MKVKLIKTNGEFTLNPPIEGFKLSLKNCQAIELGYDLDELSLNEANKREGFSLLSQELAPFRLGYLRGFQKALELMGDKKFSEDYLKRMCSISFNFYKRNDLSDSELEEEWRNWLKNTIQSLQQVEWDVEIVMEYINIGAVSNCFHPKDFETEIIKRDGDGCLILKRI